MQITTIVLVLIALSSLGFLLGRRHAIRLARQSGGLATLHSLPNHYGYLAALWVGLPGLLLLGVAFFFQESLLSQLVIAHLPSSIQTLPADQLGLYYNQIAAVANGSAAGIDVSAQQIAAADVYSYWLDRLRLGKVLLVFLLALVGAYIAMRRIVPTLPARNIVERAFTGVLFACSFLAILTTLGIVVSVLFEAIRFFSAVPMSEFLLGMEWSPQIAIRSDQVGASGSFGFVPLLAGTLLISAVAMVIAVPIGLMSAIYLAEYATPGFRAVAKPTLEILAGVPTVVYGFFAALTVAPLVRQVGESLGVTVASESALAAGLVMGIMIIPFVMSLSDDIITAVPDSLREASLGMGATVSETIRYVLFPAALPGIVGGILLAVSRAIGETMIVVMAAGLSAKLTANPLEAVTTITVQIVTLLVGDQAFDSPKTLAAFALGLVLFFVTLLLNVVALSIVRRYREQYE